MQHVTSRRRASWLLAALLGLAVAVPARAQEAKPRLDITGFAMLDMGYQFGQNHPDWYDVLRPTKLPAYKDEFGKDGRFFAGVRQSRLGFRGYIPTGLGELKTIFEFELFGTGVDAGQTTFRLRHAWGELGQIGAGQTWSVFMDPDAFPNSLEYWGPNGITWFRNVQLRWTPLQGSSTLRLALERPGASGDQGVYDDRIELDGIQGRFPLPDFSAQYRREGKWGHVQLAGIVRQIKWDDAVKDQYDLAGSTTGWGINLSSNLKLFKEDVLHVQGVYGEGIQNYMNDAPVDVGIQTQPGNATTPVTGKALPVLGLTAFYDRTWSSKWSTSVGGSLVDIENSDGQSADAFQRGSYALVNLLHYPVPGVMIGAELQYGRRDNNSDGWFEDDVRVQFGFRYSFKQSIGGN